MKKLIRKIQPRRREKISCIRPDYLNQLTNNNSAMKAEMIQVYLEETPMLLNKMKISIDTANWDLLRSTAHSILPSFSIMGIDKRFTRIANEIQEHAGRLCQPDFGGEDERSSVPILNKLLLSIEKGCINAFKELNIELALLKLR